MKKNDLCKILVFKTVEYIKMNSVNCMFVYILNVLVSEYCQRCRRQCCRRQCCRRQCCRRQCCRRQCCRRQCCWRQCCRRQCCRQPKGVQGLITGMFLKFTLSRRQETASPVMKTDSVDTVFIFKLYFLSRYTHSTAFLFDFFYLFLFLLFSGRLSLETQYKIF